MFQYLLDHIAVFNRGYAPNKPTALFTFLYVYGKHAGTCNDDRRESNANDKTLQKPNEVLEL